MAGGHTLHAGEQLPSQEHTTYTRTPRCQTPHAEFKQVRRAGRGHGVFHVDTLLAQEYGDKGAGGLDGNGAGPLAG